MTRPDDFHVPLTADEWLQAPLEQLGCALHNDGFIEANICWKAQKENRDLTPQEKSQIRAIIEREQPR